MKGSWTSLSAAPWFLLCWNSLKFTEVTMQHHLYLRAPLNLSISYLTNPKTYCGSNGTAPLPVPLYWTSLSPIWPLHQSAFASLVSDCFCSRETQVSQISFFFFFFYFYISFWYHFVLLHYIHLQIAWLSWSFWLSIQSEQLIRMFH